MKKFQYLRCFPHIYFKWSQFILLQTFDHRQLNIFWIFFIVTIFSPSSDHDGIVCESIFASNLHLIRLLHFHCRHSNEGKSDWWSINCGDDERPIDLSLTSSLRKSPQHGESGWARGVDARIAQTVRDCRASSTFNFCGTTQVHHGTVYEPEWQ